MSYTFSSHSMAMPLQPFDSDDTNAHGHGPAHDQSVDPHARSLSHGQSHGGDVESGAASSAVGGAMGDGELDGLSAHAASVVGGDLSSWERRMRWDIYSRSEFVVESSWLRPSRFLMWKLVAFSWSLSVWIMTLVNQRAPVGKFFVFLTHWNQTSVLLYLGSSLYICARHWLGRKAPHLPEADTTRAGSSSYTPSSALLRFSFLALEHSVAWTTLVVLVYWSTEFPSFLRRHDAAGYVFFLNVAIHGLIMALIYTDLMLSRVEFVLGHLAYTLPISALYLAVNGIYCAVAGGFIYEVLKWTNFVTAVAAIGCALFIVLMFPVGHWLCKQRNRISGNQAPVTGKWCVCSPE